MEYLNEAQAQQLEQGIIEIQETINGQTVFRVKESLSYLKGLGAPKVTI